MGQSHVRSIFGREAIRRVVVLCDSARSELDAGRRVLVVAWDRDEASVVKARRLGADVARLHVTWPGAATVGIRTDVVVAADNHPERGSTWWRNCVEPRVVRIVEGA